MSTSDFEENEPPKSHPIPEPNPTPCAEDSEAESNCTSFVQNTKTEDDASHWNGGNQSPDSFHPTDLEDGGEHEEEEANVDAAAAEVQAEDEQILAQRELVRETGLAVEMAREDHERALEHLRLVRDRLDQEIEEVVVDYF